MTENEKRILTLLSKQGPLSKRELARKGRMGWATVVKMVSRLEEAGIVQCVGTDSQPVISGKDPAVYNLSGKGPLAIGIDVSYSRTTIIVSNLKHEVLEQQSYETPQRPDIIQLKDFLLRNCEQFMQTEILDRETLAGVGIGLPRWVGKNDTITFGHLAEELEAQLQLPVRIEECTARNYAMYKKWIGRAFPLNDFIVMTIRNGVGAGTFYQGQLIRGAHGMAGELGHLTIVDNEIMCRCGKQGCLETMVNQDILYREYVRRIRGDEDTFSASAPADSVAVHKGLAELFSLAQQEHQEASAIIKKAAHYIGMGIAILLMVFDIPNVIISGHFGDAGSTIIPYIEEEVNRRIITGINYEIDYYPLEQLGFAYGAALLILNDYLTELEI